ncbi:MAG: hypothetical protein HN985_08245 [Planctomycetaceae bacterium]|nr:hypothetical protein [Planctomycetaceae bacterium]MBT6919698.1 hypothetical protein [Planctomycetaceae bacterium]MBT7728351.1 hypothetical protein [Planctomycetaceae bacterium]
MKLISGRMFNQVVWIFVLGSGLLFATSGCSTVLTVAYLFHPEDVPAEYNELRGKHVVVVCKPIVELEFTDAGTARELADRIGANIRENVRGVKIISQQEVSRWLDENAWVDYATLGEAVDADIVVGIDLDHFSLHEGSTLYRGRTTVHMQVHDVNDDLIVFDKRMEDFTFPADSAIPTADQSEQQFRGLFLRILSSRLSRCFHAYESRAHFAEENLIY